MSMFDSLTHVALFVLIPVILIYVIHPLTQKGVPLHRVGRQFSLFNPADLAPDVAPFFYQNERAIASLGFEIIGYLTRVDASGMSTSCQIYMVNRATMERATVVGVYGIMDGQVRLRSHYFEFTTKFVDGSTISTNNLHSSGVFKTVAKYRTARLTMVGDPVSLYDVHKYHVAKYIDGRQKYLPPPGQEIEAYEQSLLDVWNAQVESGLATFDPQSQTFGRTWYGTYYMVWCQLWPMKQIRLAQRRAYAENLLKECEADRRRMATVA